MNDTRPDRPHTDQPPPDRHGVVVDGAEGVEGVEGAILRFERRYDAPPSEVWSALTDPERLARWLFRATLEPRPGGTLTFHLGEYGDGSGTVVAWDEPHLLEYRWVETPAVAAEHAGAAETWWIRFRLRSDGDSTVLTFEHLSPDPRRPQFAAGWHWYLDRLARVVSGDPPADVTTDEEFDRLMAVYTERA